MRAALAARLFFLFYSMILLFRGVPFDDRGVDLRPVSNVALYFNANEKNLLFSLICNRFGTCKVRHLKRALNFLFTGLPVWQTQSRSAFSLFDLFFVFFIFFFVSVKVLPLTPLVSGVFVHRAFCAYFPRIERVVELRRFLWRTQ